ncbi:MAG TPA: Ig-like domain-containing protein [Candidatus Sulfotelmatobacter sp.]|nr:Ig-like domain-containing protein [Candidatus Sulfotelmatobacter sp.]
MRKPILGLALLLFSAFPSLANWGVVQQTQSTLASATTTTNAQFGTSVTAGDLIIVHVNWFDTTNNVSSVTDTLGNTFISAAGPARRSGAVSTQLFYAANVTAGIDQIVVVMSAATKIDMFVYEISGAATTNPFDVASTGSGSGTAVTAGSITTGAPGDFVFVGIGNSGQSWNAPGTNFIGLQENAFALGEFATVAAAGGAVTGTSTFSVSVQWSAAMAAFHCNPGTITGGTPTLTSIQVSPASPTFSMGTSRQFTATGVFNDGSTQDLTNSATWSSGNPSVATVSTSGFVTATSHGTSSISAASGSISGSTALLVEGSLTALQITPANASLPQGAIQQFTATGSFSDSTSENLTSSVRWSSSNTAVATVNASGLVTTSGVGSATITATSGSMTTSAPLTVTQPSGVIGPPVSQAPLVQTNYQSFTSYYMGAPPAVGGSSCTPAPCIAQTFLNANTAGNLIFVWASWSSGGFTLSNLSDTAGNLYTHVPGYPAANSNGSVSDFWVAYNVVASSNNRVTAQFGSGTVSGTYLQIMEYSGLAAVNAMDVSSAVAARPSCTAPCTLSTAPSPVTNQPAELVVAIFDVLNCSSTCTGFQFTAQSGWSPDENCTGCVGWGGTSVSGAVLIEHRLVSAVGSFTATASESSVSFPKYNSYLFTFKQGP